MKTKRNFKSISFTSPFFYFIFFFVFLSGIFMFSGCNKEHKEDSELKIKNLNIPSELTILAESSITIGGEGFSTGDIIELKSATDSKISFVINATEITNRYITFTLPESIQSGSYNIILLRGDRFLFLGTTNLTITPNTNIPDITNINIPSLIETFANENISLRGRGFMDGDIIRLQLTSDENTEYKAPLFDITAFAASFTIPKDMVSGEYKFILQRGTESLFLGISAITIKLNMNLPDVEGMTIKGVVYCNNTGVPDVVVSDGIEVVKTDKNGIYYLPSAKKNGFVFISVPGNYEVSTEGRNMPLFYERLKGGNQTEQINFSLNQVDNNKHVVLALADMHLAKRNNDITQFTNGFKTDIKTTIDTYRNSGTKVYGLTLGDMTWDLYWYSNNFQLNDYLSLIKDIDIPIFNAMGNHDNNPYGVGDWDAEQKFKDIIGPTYYSFNLGKAHYIVMDDVEYINKGGSEGIIGDRKYNRKLSADQLSWLQKDLNTIADKSTPIFVAMHVQVHAIPTSLTATGKPVANVTMSSGNELLSILKEFSNVHILTGHTHVNYIIEASESVTEHNIAAVCATWWWTGKNGYAGNHICKDGSPGGYGVFEIENNNIQWYYKGIGENKNKQFRSYDLNECYVTAEKYAPNSTEAKMKTYSGEYAIKNEKNQVLLNIWGHDMNWNIEVTENGNPLKVTRVVKKDPLHIISYEAKRLNANADPTADFVSNNTAHLFMVTASSPTSTLEIKVTDRFGNIYKETMTRPKELKCSMQ